MHTCNAMTPFFCDYYYHTIIHRDSKHSALRYNQSFYQKRDVFNEADQGQSHTARQGKQLIDEQLTAESSIVLASKKFKIQASNLCVIFN